VISGAVAVKELRGYSRRWTTYLLRGLFVGGAVLVLWSWRSDLVQAAANPSEYAHVGRQLFNSLSLLQMAAVLLSALMAGSDLVTSEVRAGTLDLLTLTPVALGRVVSGKWLAALLQSLSLLLAGAPALAMGIFLGGVDPEQLLVVLGGTLSFAMLAAALAVLASAVARSPIRAFFNAFFAFVLAYLGLALLQVLFFRFVDVDRTTILASQCVLVALPVPISGLLLLRATRRTRQRLLRNERTSGLARDEAFETKGSYYSPRLAISGGVWENRPLLWKELATRAGGRLPRAGRIVLLVLATLLTVFLCLAGASGEAPVIVPFVGSIYLVAALAQGSSLFAAENSGRRWDMLLTAPLSAVDIVRAKLAAGIVAREALYLLFLLGASLAASSSSLPGVALLAVPITCLAFLALAYALAAAVSLHVRNPRRAFLGSAGAVGVLLLFPQLLVQGPFDAVDLPRRAVLSLSPLPLLEAWFSSRHASVRIDDLGLYSLLNWTGTAVVVWSLVAFTSRRVRAVAATM
jgi:hypothetical protein